MITLLVLALLFLMLFGGLGYIISPLFYIALLFVLLFALGGGYYGHRHGW